MAVSDSSSEYIHPVIAALTASTVNGKSVTLHFEGGDMHIVNGQWKMVPNGTRDLAFRPGKGVENLCRDEPPSPLKTSPSSTKVPAQTGFRLGSAAASLALAMALVEAMKNISDWGDMLQVRKAHDIEMIMGIVTCIEASMSPAQNQARNRQLQRRKSGSDNARRYRIWGYSRKGA